MQQCLLVTSPEAVYQICSHKKNLYTTFSTYAGALAPRPVNTSNVEKRKVLSDILRDEFKNTTNNVDFNGTEDAEWS